jgi:transcriptional regulator with XRE-family HTH domain
VFDLKQPQGNRLMPNPVDAKIGSQIRSLRISRDLTEEVLADRIGVTFRQMRRYERGTSRVSIVQLTEIAGALGVSVSTFFNGFAKSEPENDNLTPLQIATKQGLALLKMFHSIADAQLRYKVLRTVEAMAQEKPTNVEAPRR